MPWRCSGRQVVAFQAMIDTMACNFPGAFAGYHLTVVESHQRSKVDASGTALAVIDSFRRLGVEFDEA
jgi:4-hydroxy-tetrahydrodipicolinate reductase